VASIHPLWYFSGAERWFDLTNDLYIKPDTNPATMDPRAYWSRFEAIAMPHTTSFTTNTGANEASLYATGILRLRGFMGSRIAPEHRWVWMSPNSEHPLDGFVWTDGKLQRFRQNAEGKFLVVSAVTSDEQAMLKALAPIQYWESDMPKRPGEQRPRSLLIMLLSEQSFDSQAGIFGEEQPLEVIRGTLQTVDPKSFSGPGSSRFPLTFRSAVHGVDVAQAGSDGYRISFGTAQWGVLALAEIPKPVQGHRYQVSLDMEMAKGGTTIQVLSGPTMIPVLTVYQETTVKHAAKSFVFQAAGADPLRIAIGAWNPNAVAPVDVTVRNATIQEVQLAR
jgi:hypothetical protein